MDGFAFLRLEELSPAGFKGVGDELCQVAGDRGPLHI